MWIPDQKIVMKKLKGFVLLTLLLTASSLLAQRGLINLTGRPSGVDTIFYPFYNDVQMIEIDHVGDWEERERYADMEWGNRGQARFSFVPELLCNVYLFRHRSGMIVKAFNTSTSLEQLTKDFSNTPINKKSGGLNSIVRISHLNRNQFVMRDYHSRMLDFHGKYLVHEISDTLELNGVGKKYPVDFGKVGLIDSFGNYLLPIEYTHLEPLNNNIIICKDSLCGVIDDALNVVLPLNYERYDYLSGGDELAFYKSNQVHVIYRVKTNTYKQVAGFDYIGEDWLFQYRYNPRPEYPPLIPVRNGFLMGLVDTGFNVVTPLIYDRCIPAFYSNLTVACRNGKFGYLDKNGREIIPCIYAYAEDFKDGIAVVQYEGKFRNIDSTGKLLNANVREHENWRNRNYSYTLIGKLKTVQTATGYGLINENDVFVVPAIYENITPLRSEHNGRTQFSDKVFSARRYGKVGIVDIAGNVLLPFEYEQINDYPSKYGFRVVRKDDKHWGMLNRNCEMIVPCIYEGMSSGYDEDHFQFWTNGKTGIMDTTGKITIPAEYNQMYLYKNNRALVQKDSLFGFIDTAGNVVIPIIFERLNSEFHNGLCLVYQNDKAGFIDTTGAIVIPCIYDNARVFTGKATGVQQGDKWALIDREGKPITEFEYSFISYEWRGEGEVQVRKNGKIGYLNSKGREVIPCEYDVDWGYSPGLGYFLEKDGQKRYVKPN